MNSLSVLGSARAALLLSLLLICLSFPLSAQTSCTVAGQTAQVATEGYAEPIGTVTFTCTGGVGGGMVAANFYIVLPVNVTNRLDVNGNPTGITVTGSGAAGAVTVGSVALYAAGTIALNAVTYTIPAASSSPVTIAVSGIRAAVASLTNGSGMTIVNATALTIGATYAGPPNFPVAIAYPTLLSSSINNGIPCAGSPVPSALNFSAVIASGTAASTIRLTEANAAAFLVKQTGADTGLRFILNLSGYPAGAQVYVPDEIVGSDPGATATTVGNYGYYPIPAPGTYTPGMNQLLLMRVTGTDSHGAGGAWVTTLPTSTTTFSTVSALTMTSGATFAVYEVVDGNPGVLENAQVPIFVSAPAAPAGCTGTITIPTFAPTIAPVSTVSVATATDPIPRYISVAPAGDCTQVGDCSASYFPTLSVSTTPITFTANSMGPKQQATLYVSNSGGGILAYSVAVTYPSGASGWLTVTPTSGQNSGTLTITADPSQLPQGVDTATITITANGQTATVPVTLTVNPVSVTIQAITNAASYAAGTVAPGSYAAIFGLDLLGNSLATVTFNGVPATVVANTATQINVIVPTTLTQVIADVVATVNGTPSNSYRVSLATSPGIFSNGILNFADGQVNSATDPVARGSFAILYLTGLLPPYSGVTVNFGSVAGVTSYVGPQPTYPSINQINVTVPATLQTTASPVPVTVCATGSSGQQVCSNAVNLYFK